MEENFSAVSECRFIILPGNPPPVFPLRHEYNLGYAHYKNVWERLFNRPGREGAFDPHTFLRQSYILQLMKQDLVVGQILCTHYNILNPVTLDCGYFHAFVGSGTDFMQANGINSILSLELLSIARAFSPRHLEGLSLGEVLTYLAMGLAESLAVDAIIGHPRRVTGTNENRKNSGGVIVDEKKQKYNVSVDVCIHPIKTFLPHQDDRVNQLARHFWEKREENYPKRNQYRREKPIRSCLAKTDSLVTGEGPKQGDSSHEFREIEATAQ